MSSNTKQIYSLRNGNNPDTEGIDFYSLKSLFNDLFSILNKRGYFAEHFGYYSLNHDNSKDYKPVFIKGTLNDDEIRYDIHVKTRKDGLWPIEDCLVNYSEDDLFDVIEYLFKYVSIPIESNYKVYDDGFVDYKLKIHTEYSTIKGQKHFIQLINQLLGSYKKPLILSENGEIQNKVEDEISNLVNYDIHLNDEYKEKLIRAKSKLLRHNATNKDKRDALGDLAHIVEYYYEKIEDKFKSPDENELFSIFKKAIFNVLNNFQIRHHNKNQKTNYDESWLDSIFYIVLAYIKQIENTAKKESISIE